MIRTFIIVIFLVVSFPLFGQVKSKDLVGEWTTCSRDSLYYKSDTVIMYQDANYQINSNCCNYVNWKIPSRRQIKIEDAFLCTEPGRLSTNSEKETFKLYKVDDRQTIIIKRGKTKVDRFLIMRFEEKKINRYPHNIKILTLQRLK
jgi:hypothetical protein